MQPTDRRMERFFAGYAARFNQGLGNAPVVDVEGTAAAFADCFVAANPQGVHCGKNDDAFRAVIPQGAEFYRRTGMTSMAVTSLQVTELDGFHTMVKVRWDSRYRRTDGREEQMEFDVIYLVQTLGETPRIFAYITGDEEKALREKGLFPSERIGFRHAPLRSAPHPEQRD
ncbi:MAG: hypothetical protein LUQ41_01660 [Methanomicrobiales archaeon]|nr:hypothetical protein [Methanomicrobiales archaeon]